MKRIITLGFILILAGCADKKPLPELCNNWHRITYMYQTNEDKPKTIVKTKTMCVLVDKKIQEPHGTKYIPDEIRGFSYEPKIKQSEAQE